MADSVGLVISIVSMVIAAAAYFESRCSRKIATQAKDEAVKANKISMHENYKQLYSNFKAVFDSIDVPYQVADSSSLQALASSVKSAELYLSKDIAERFRLFYQDCSQAQVLSLENPKIENAIISIDPRINGETYIGQPVPRDDLENFRKQININNQRVAGLILSARTHGEKLSGDLHALASNI